MKLPNGEEVYDLSGKWDVNIENYGVYERFGSYPQIFEITQEGKSFTGIRLKDNPPPAIGKAGNKCAQGEVDKSGISKFELVDGGGQALSTNWQVSEDGNRIKCRRPRPRKANLDKKMNWPTATDRRLPATAFISPGLKGAGSLLTFFRRTATD